MWYPYCDLTGVVEYFPTSSLIADSRKFLSRVLLSLKVLNTPPFSLLLESSEYYLAKSSNLSPFLSFSIISLANFKAFSSAAFFSESLILSVASLAIKM